MSTQHTPGPWKQLSDGIKRHDEDYCQIRDSKGQFIANTAVAISSTRLDEARANARLIAAAPDLLAACDDRQLDAAHDQLSAALEDPEATHETIRKQAVKMCMALNAHHEKRRAAIARATQP